MYAQRNQAGNLIGVFSNPQPGFAEEEIAEDSPDVVAFLNPQPAPLTVTEKLASVGLTVAELKAELAK